MRPADPAARNARAAAGIPRTRRHVDGQDPLELLERGVEGRLAADDARVADADVDAAERRGHVSFGGAGSPSRPDDVGAATERGDLRGGFRRVAALDEADVGAEPGERDRDRRPMPGSLR